MESTDVQHNTNLWAHAKGDKQPSRQTMDIGDIETNKMNLQEKSLLLHNVAIGAERDLTEQVKTQKNTEEEERADRYQQAEELDQQVIALDKMNFSAHDLNDFSALTNQRAETTFQLPAAPKKLIQVDTHVKDFYE